MKCYTVLDGPNLEHGWRIVEYRPTRMMDGNVYWTKHHNLPRKFKDMGSAVREAKRRHKPFYLMMGKMNDSELIEFMLEEEGLR
jgi:hypothetical protein